MSDTKFTRERLCIEYKKQHDIVENVLVSPDCVTSAFCTGYTLGENSLRDALSDVLDGYSVHDLVDGWGLSEERAVEIMGLISSGGKHE